MLAFLVAFVAIGLATDENWWKLLRVTLAAAVYAGALMRALRVRRTPAPRVARIPWWPFALAGGAAGAVSGTVQPLFEPRMLVVGTAAAALLLGTCHWLALRWWAGAAPNTHGRLA